jgi:hypothetical protein
MNRYYAEELDSSKGGDLVLIEDLLVELDRLKNIPLYQFPEEFDKFYKELKGE